MPFDRTDPTHLKALRDMVMGDPRWPEGSTTDALRIANGDSGETTPAPLTVADLVGLAATFSDELTANPAVPPLFQAVSALDDERDVVAFLPRLEALLGPDSQIVAAAKANTRPLSRAEVAFGAGTEIIREDWLKARFV